MQTQGDPHSNPTKRLAHNLAFANNLYIDFVVSLLLTIASFSTINHAEINQGVDHHTTHQRIKYHMIQQGLRPGNKHQSPNTVANDIMEATSQLDLVGDVQRGIRLQWPRRVE